jgi:hypothetical protein
MLPDSDRELKEAGDVMIIAFTSNATRMWRSK